ncbi:YCF48-related protein [uncultured Abyssibacter sp.]|uniref:WD40/YVTN/BNR-like repeat-containing protein n=1 Tax=uncultured Abyssibacter sp. TaxID=2320202 RepID=UPI0032B2B608
MTSRALTASLLAGCLATANVAAATESDAKDDPRMEPAEMMELADQRILVGLTEVADGYLAVGMRGHILRSTDGKAWTQVASPVRSMLVTLDFPTDSTGYIGGHDGVILKSSDGGQEWTLQHFDNAPQRPAIIYDLMFEDEETGFAVGSYGLILRTSDGGENWTPVETDLEFLGFHNSQIVRISDEMMLIVGEKGLAARSSDDGQTWEMLVSPYTGSFFGAIPDGQGGALIYGMRGRLYRIADVSAVETQSPMDYDPFMAANVDDPQVLAEMGWEYLETPTSESFFGATAMPDGSVTLVGNAGLIMTGNPDSRSWSVQTNPNGDTLAGVLPVNGELLTVGRQGVEWH